MALSESYAALAAEYLPAEVADRWLGLLRPCAQLIAARGSEPVVGRLGGLPRLPEGTEWPCWPGHGPLSFIASVDCAALPGDALDLAFPDEGTLLFFYFDGQYDDDAVVFVDDPDTWAGARVLYVPAGTDVRERETPDGLMAYEQVELTVQVQPSVLDRWHPQSKAALPAEGTSPDPRHDSGAGVSAFLDAVDDLRSRFGHRIGGHADPVQNHVEYEVAHAVLGRQTRWDDPRIDSEARRWVLLAQFDSDSDAGMMWGDVGALYWLIRPEDLAARRFEAAMFTWQCC